MPWARLDDKFWRNAKMQSLSHPARGVWVNCVSYCADTTEPTGFLTYKEARERGPQRLIQELVNGGAFEPVNGGYLIHDFDKYLDKGSRDRCRRWRESKRKEGVTGDAGETSQTRHQSVTDASPRATGMETTSTSVFPVPVPEPGPDGDAVLEPLTNGRAVATRLREIAAAHSRELQ